MIGIEKTVEEIAAALEWLWEDWIHVCSMCVLQERWTMSEIDLSIN
jgi:hypothetical protein